VKVKIQVIVESDQGETQILQEVTSIHRGCLQPENVGLTLTEAKTLLQKTQQVVVQQQIAEAEQQHASCQHCAQKRRHKDQRSIIYRTLFGKLQIPCHRLFHCECSEQPTRSFTPIAQLLPERTSPERLYLESKFASLMSYGLSRQIFQEILPLEGEINATSIRNHLHNSGKRLEAELPEEAGNLFEGCPRDWEKLPQPDLPLVVGLDGGYVRYYERKSSSKGHFQVITGKSIKADGTSKCFGLVDGYDPKPQRRIFEVLKSQGMQMNQQVTFLSDGEERIRELQYDLNPNAEHLLDWFHIAMRITVMTQIAKGITKEDLEAEISSASIQEALKRLKWSLWHGNVYKALSKIEDLIEQSYVLASDEEGQEPSLEAEKLVSYLEEFETYISNNGKYIPNYGDRHHNGERISSSFVESTVNQVISKRFVKKQQMRWTPEGAHLLIQVRAQVLNGEWSHKFQQWYPGATVNSEPNQPVPRAA